MKNLGLVIFTALSALIFSCSKTQQPEKPNRPLELRSTYIIARAQPANIVSNKIISGNGDYTVVYPKTIYYGESGQDMPYPDYLEILDIRIEESDDLEINEFEHSVVVEFKTDGQEIVGLFMVKDVKGERKPFEAWFIPGSEKIVGGPHSDVMDWEAEDPGKDYWVNY